MTASPLIIVCDWLPPEFGAVGQYQLRRARAAAIAGRTTVLIGLGRADSVTEERVGLGAASLTLVRLAAPAPDRANLLRRALWALSINGALLDATARAAKKAPDAEILVTGSPPFLSYLLIVWALFFHRRGTLTYRITDFYPETAIAATGLSALVPLRPVIRFLRRRAARIEALSDCQRRRLQESGVPASKVAIVRDDAPVEMTEFTRRAPRPFGEEAVVLLYSGNLGVAHDWETFAHAYRAHVRSGANRVRLWLNATGAGAVALRRWCEQEGLPMHATPPCPLEELAGVLLAADMHLVTLKPGFWGYVIPSKIYACVASGRPILYVGPKESDLHDMALEVPGSASVRNGDVAACLAALEAAAHHAAVAPARAP